MTILLYPAQQVNPFMLPAKRFRTPTKRTTRYLGLAQYLHTFSYKHQHLATSLQSANISCLQRQSTRHEIYQRFRRVKEENQADFFYHAIPGKMKHN
jgi:hypothetical protein